MQSGARSRYFANAVLLHGLVMSLPPGPRPRRQSSILESTALVIVEVYYEQPRIHAADLVVMLDQPAVAVRVAGLVGPDCEIRRISRRCGCGKGRNGERADQSEPGTQGRRPACPASVQRRARSTFYRRLRRAGRRDACPTFSFVIRHFLRCLSIHFNIRSHMLRVYSWPTPGKITLSNWRSCR